MIPINFEKIIIVLLILGIAYLAFWPANQEIPPEEPPPAPEPIACTVETNHKATDGGRLLIVHCPPEIFEETES